MKFLIDNQLPQALCGLLRARGHEAAHLFDLGMSRASDLEVCQFAARDGCTIVTKDEDFSILAAIGKCTVPVIWVRFGNCRIPSLLDFFTRSFDAIEERLRSGEGVIQLMK
jgi:predicted nuclease of predicted toxin-antitoxin system